MTNEDLDEIRKTPSELYSITEWLADEYPGSSERINRAAQQIQTLIAEVERLRAELTCDCGRKMYATCGSCDRDLD